MKIKLSERSIVLIVSLVAFISIMIMVFFSGISFSEKNNLSGNALATLEDDNIRETPNVKMTYTIPDAGIYDEPLEVELMTLTEGATIRYTLDGSSPTEESNIYTRPIKVYEDTNIKAKAYKEGHTPSTTMLARFFIR